MCFNCRLNALAVCAVAAASALAFGQTSVPDTAASPASTSCNPWKMQSFSADLSVGERTCLEFSPLASPALAVETGLMAGLSQWRNNPHMKRSDSDDIAVRFEHMYERRTARVTAETLVGYLHHEDPRLRVSNEQGAWRRTRFALLSVLESPDQDGNVRIALAPLAGSLGSGLTSMALYQRQNSLGYGLERAGIVYGHYFARALYHEFSPQIWSLAPHFIRKRHADTLSVD